MASPSSRNAPCPCGSGKRFKDCHGRVAAEAPPAPDADELLRRAQVAFANGQGAAAETRLRRLLAQSPDHVGAWNLLGEVLRSSNPAAADQAWWHALNLDPDDAEASFHLGNRNREFGEHVAAVIHFERALRRAPNHAGLLNNLGLSAMALGDQERAESCYRAAITAEPQHAAAQANLANLLFQREQYAELLKVTGEQLTLLGVAVPSSVRLLRALAQERLGDAAEAEATLQDAVAQWPGDATLRAYLGTLYVRRSRYAEGEAELVHSLELAPDSAYTLSMLAHARQRQCAWSGLSEMFLRIDALASRGVEELVPIDAFSALAMPLSPAAQLQIAKRWARRFTPPQPIAAPVVSYGPGERLRVAFVTWNLRDHPTMHLSLEFWEKIDRSRLEMFLYSLRPDDDNPFQRRARTAFEHYADVSQASVAEIAQRIRADRIGILIDRNGYTLNAREGIFALRPAPIQVNCIGFPGTLGAPWYDYIFTDHFTVPQHLRRFYSERPLYMPHMAFPSDTTRLPAGPAPTRAALGLPEQAFVFCCFNNAYKILPEVFAVWMRLLAAVPGSVLWLLEPGGEAKANLQREAQAAGIDPSRLVFAPPVAIGAHVARNAAADLFVDTFPYGAHTTANDALLAGLPLITCAGETLASRIAGSQLHAIGLPELVTTSLADYESLALKLATEPKLLAGYRARLAANRHTHPLFDMARYARDFEDAMLRAWDEQRASAA